MSELQIAPTRRLMKNAGAQRVSSDAVKYLNEYLEEEGMEIVTKATQLAAHAGRLTIMKEDIKLAMR